MDPATPAPHPRPTLPEPPKLSADATFTQQVRDTEWAPSTESEIKKRFVKVRGGKLAEAECRQSQCKLTIAGSQGEISRTIADLESDRGLHGYATTILLTAPEKKPDGSLVLRAYATFER